MSRPAPAPKRARSSRKPWRPPRDRKELMKAIGAGAAVVVLSVGAVLFLGRDYLGGDDSTPTTPLPTSPVGSVTTPTTPETGTPDTTLPVSTPSDSSAPAGSETPIPTDAAVTSTTLPGAPTP